MAHPHLARCFLCRPSHALYFASYEAAKELYGGNREGHRPLATAAAGACVWGGGPEATSVAAAALQLALAAVACVL